MSHALKDILALSGRPPDWIVKCQSGFNGSLKHDSLRSPIPVAFGLGEALTGGAKCSVMASCGDFGRQDELLAQSRLVNAVSRFVEENVCLQLW
jgi:hypothetical protein